MKFSKISLKKQLSLLLIALLVFIVGYLVPTINDNLTRITDNEMYTTLTMVQNSYYLHKVDLQDSLLDRQVYHIYYDKEEGVIMPTDLDTNDEVLSMSGVFYGGLEHVIESNSSFYRSKGVFEEYDMYYQIIEVVEGRYLVSLLHSTYSKQLFNSLQYEIIYMLYTTVLVIAIALFLWADSLITPLQQIRKYINSMNSDVPYDLQLDRNDEIGILFKSLNKIKYELDLQSKHRDEMLHNISHDLKTPIALIKTYTQSVQDGVHPYGTLESSVDIILENADRLESKVTSLLHLNHLDYSVEEKKASEVDMKALIEHLVDQMRAMHPEIEIKLYLKPVYFEGDIEHWRICVENILENAYRYVDSKIIIWLRQDYLEIYNDGASIPDKNVHDLFLPYKKGIKGQFGLGLSIVLKTVSLYEYEVFALNLEVGVSFVIYK